MEDYTKIIDWAESWLAEHNAKPLSSLSEKERIKIEVYAELVDSFKKIQSASNNYSVDYSCPERNRFIESMEKAY